ncbi:MAG: membrane protein insertase YidC [Rikenellaceae bacterium]
MDKGKIAGLILIVVLYIGFIVLSGKEQEKYQTQLEAYEAQLAKQQRQLDEQRVVSIPKSEEQVRSESAAVVGEELASAKVGESKRIKVSNDVMNIEFDTRGGQVVSVELKDYTKYSDGERTELVNLFDPTTAKMDLSFYIRKGNGNVRVNTMEYNFVAEPLTSFDGGQRLVLSLDFGGDAALKYIYTIYNSESKAANYLVDFTIEMDGMSTILANQSSMGLAWSNRSYQNERGFNNENTYTTVAYHHTGEPSIEELSISKEGESKQVSTAVDWVAFKQQYFSSVLIAAGGGISTADVAFNTAAPQSGYIKDFMANMTLPLNPTSDRYDLKFYFGPNEFSTLEQLNDLGMGDLAMEKLVPLGWGIFGWVNKWLVIPVFNILRGHIASFGVIILILAVLIKVLIAPLTYSSYISMAKMRVVKPQIDEISAKYPKTEDAQKRQQATMELYRKTGINPMGGCLPLVIQMPIIIAMFRFFPASIELRDQSFLWANDLSSYDSVLTLPFEIPFYGDHVSLWALLMAIVMFFYSKMNYNQTASSQPQMAGMKFMMLYVMPIMMLAWFNSYSSGLCYYYFLTNLLTIAQTVMIRRFVDDDKILATLHANAAKNKTKGKSKFQLKYEEMLAQQEATKGKKR